MQAKHTIINYRLLQYSVYNLLIRQEIWYMYSIKSGAQICADKSLPKGLHCATTLPSASQEKETRISYDPRLFSFPMSMWALPRRKYGMTIGQFVLYIYNFLFSSFISVSISVKTHTHQYESSDIRRHYSTAIFISYLHL